MILPIFFKSLAWKRLSDDFLLEAKRAARDKDHSLELRFLIPKQERNFEKEVLIKRRLRDHFKKHASAIEREIQQIKKRGIFLAILGLFMLLLAATISYYGRRGLFSNLL